MNFMKIKIIFHEFHEIPLPFCEIHDFNQDIEKILDIQNREIS